MRGPAALCVVLLAVGGLATASAAAELDTATLDTGTTSIDLAARVQVLRDEEGRLTYDDVTRGAAATHFAPVGREGLNFGFTQAAYWYRFRVSSPPDAGDDQWVLEIAWPPLDFIDVYVAGADGAVQVVRTGDQRPPGASGIASHDFAVPMTLKPGTSTIHIRAQIDGAQQLPLKLWRRAAWFAKDARGNLLYGIFYGIMLVMLLYNLILYLVLREPSYPSFLLFLAGIAALLVNLDGFAFEWLWAVSPKLVNGSVPVTIAVTDLALVRFIQVSLQTRQQTPRLHRLLSIVQALAAAGLVLVFVSSIMVSTFLNTLVGGGTALLAVAVIVVESVKGNRTARFYAPVWAAMLLGILTKMLQANGVLPVNAFTTYAIHIGACLLVTLLSLALADQISVARREKAQLAREKAEARAAAQSEFLDKMSHELRTPMNAIVGFIDLALRDRSDAQRLEHLRLIDSASRSLLGIVDNVLDLTRIGSGKLPIEATAFELPALVERVARLVRPAARADVAFRFVLAPDVPALVVGDPLRVEQVLVNLCENALKFTETGEVVLAVTAADGGPGLVALEFRVRDTGIGISAERLTQVYKPFTQADQSTTRRYGGSGLGLAICKQLADLMGGTLDADSEPGRGSEFRFHLTLPLAEETAPAPLSAPVAASTPPLIAAAADPTTTPAGARDVRGAHILLAEDNAINRRLAGEILGDAGALLDMAEDGAQAVAAVQARRYDLVLMDVQMPVMDGYEATRRIRALPGCERLPVIALTANALAHDREEAAAAGMVDFLAKPIDAARLVGMVARWLPQRPFDPEAEQRLGRLAQLIEARDFQAESYFREMESRVAVAFPHAARDLSGALASFDFTLAGELVSNLLRGLGRNAGS